MHHMLPLSPFCRVFKLRNSSTIHWNGCMISGGKISSNQGKTDYKIHQLSIQLVVHVLSGSQVLWKVILMEVEVHHVEIHMQWLLRMQWYLDTCRIQGHTHPNCPSLQNLNAR
ncbi:uncharacterized protein BT62DRAFT_312201 [Guyanagaster necrorhizus]|uniref:Uncharacterized protein n=1 Tax=Guyanagaster necrorhizus TaxID=856835 RepID=A0A9P7VM44_9AGAR|nr:uncharacterized protein BT62DRAFT_312201 [Guyanagaster necrorhizus MCA 3950]KAG7443728.1 hypothetical protein BT62DRAFT_312201 [Guyanagaster necrorhizus MCA 3950]